MSSLCGACFWAPRKLMWSRDCAVKLLPYKIRQASSTASSVAWSLVRGRQAALGARTAVFLSDAETALGNLVWRRCCAAQLLV